MNVTGSIVMDLRPTGATGWDSDHAAECLVWQLEGAPTGSNVVLVVERKQLLNPRIGHIIREQAPHVGTITVESDDPETITRWVGMLRGGDMLDMLGRAA